MRGLLVLCMVAVACGDKLGYNYQPLGHHVPVERGPIGGSNRYTKNNIHSSGHGFAGRGFSGDSNINKVDSSIITGGGNYNSEVLKPDESFEFKKQFFSYSAPEEDFNDPEATERIANSIKKNLRIVFIKSPENQALTNAALQLAKQASEDRTAIYVLNKQVDVGELANKLQTIQSSNTNKPEVHFVKYRTPEDAVRAQQVIQAEYDTLEGPSHTSDEGVAPVLNFVSRSPSAPKGFVSSSSVNGGGSSSSSSSSYSSLSSSSSASFNAHQSAHATYLPPALRVK